MLLGDKAYSARAHRAHLRTRSVTTVIPEPADQAAHRKRLDTALVALATNLAEGLVDPTTYGTARAGLLDRRDAAARDLEQAEAELARLAPLPDDVHDRLVTPTENMDMAEWSALVRQVVRSAEVHPETIVMRPVVGEPVEVPRR